MPRHSQGLGYLKPSLPIPAGSQWAGSLPELYQALGPIDFAIVPGRGTFKHLQGPEGGARSLQRGGKR
jgi:ribulose-bisphosphate carboxylase large chain